jgi:hypothetical protein
MLSSARRMALSSVSWVMRMNGAVWRGELLLVAEFEVSSRPLHDAGDRNLLVRQDPRHRGHLSRAIIEFERHVVAALMGAHAGALVGFELLGGNAEGAGGPAARDIADVAGNA